MKYAPLSLLLFAALVDGRANPIHSNIDASAHGIRASGRTGDSACDKLMCVTATVNGNATEYVMQSKGAMPLGWMGVGFGRIMAHTAMVIMWPNDDGSITLSQRTAPREVMPTVVKNPPRIADVSAAGTYLDGDFSKLAFNIPTVLSEKRKIIWAYGRVRPDSSAVDARIHFHAGYGHAEFNLTKPIIEEPEPEASEEVPEELESGVEDVASSPYQKTIITHAVICIIGFLIVLPVGSLIARYLRTFSPIWFQFHWVLQFIFGGTAAIFGGFLGYRSVEAAGASHYNDAHKKWGVALLFLYFVQCGFGAIIHWKRPAIRIWGILHAVFGLTVIALSFYQVRLGYKYEWPAVTGRDVIKPIENTWIVLIILLPILYAIGLALLPKQFAQDHKKMTALEIDKLEMESRPLNAGEVDED